MRISDWSSDVCSSDLWRGRPPATGDGLFRVHRGAKSAEARWQAFCRSGAGRLYLRILLRGRQAARPQVRETGCRTARAARRLRYRLRGSRRKLDREIGRAACRERGCQNVEISGVAVTLKKK